jgi:hypothetical protein
MFLSFDSAFSFLGIHPAEILALVYKEKNVRIFIRTLLATLKIENNSNVQQKSNSLMSSRYFLNNMEPLKEMI